MKIFFLSLLFLFSFSSLAFASEKEFLQSYEKFQKIIKKDRNLADITTDISQFLEAKKSGFSKNHDSRIWKRLFSKNSHLNDEFSESWAQILLNKNFEEPFILGEAQGYQIDHFVSKLFQKNDNSHENTKNTLKNFIREQLLTEHIATKPDEVLEEKYLKEKAKSSLLYKVLLGVFYDAENKKEASIDILKQAFQELKENESFRYLSFYVLNVVARNERHTAKRFESARTYQKLTDLWKSQGEALFPPSLRGPERSLDKINDLLWSARYQALVGEKKLAEDEVRSVFLEIKKQGKSSLNGKQRSKLLGYLFEAYHLEIFRISFYYGDFKLGTELAAKVLEEEKVPNYWIEDFHWLLGFGFYLQGETKKAVNAWENYLSKRKYASNKDQIYFWLGRSYKKLGKEKESKFFLAKLEKEFPFSFYRIVTSNLTNFFPKKTTEEKKETRRTEEIDKNNKLLISLVRAEILIASGLIELAQGELENTYYLTSPRKFTTKNLDFYLYISKLFFHAEMYPRSIALTEALSKRYPQFWQNEPEALSLYYPDAFKNDFEKVSQDFSIKKTLLLSISRKESLFNPKAKSPANALGLMQLIPKTASVRAEELGLKNFEPEKDLFVKETNLALSGSYLKKLDEFYRGDLKRIVAAYNAGEFCVDKWSETIQVEDDIAWTELIPFGETRNYVKSVLVSEKFYEHLLKEKKAQASHLMTYTGKYFSL